MKILLWGERHINAYMTQFGNNKPTDLLHNCR